MTVHDFTTQTASDKNTYMCEQSGENLTRDCQEDDNVKK